MSKGDVAFLLTLAGMLRAGILADPIPEYRPRDLRWWPPFDWDAYLGISRLAA
ncbi:MULTISPECIES: hypothetical protein [unclassified Methylobacterium]|uniref:hypothetical protein n=1 Tax=unclassified Methylobacterium TaxID=2615210 RepID=UPI00164FCB73|nr:MULTISPECIES: hypothetical protein [unclassified Methylobacterium]